MLDEEELFKQSRLVIHNAIARLHVHPRTELYDELFANASEKYIAYLRKYRDPLETPSDIERFNRIAGNILYKQLLNDVQRMHRNWDKFNAKDLDDLITQGQEPPHTDDYGLLDFSPSSFFSSLQHSDMEILYLHTRGLKNREIARQVYLSEATVSRKIRRMRSQLTNQIQGDE